MTKLIDQHNRHINYLRLSVTDRCNLRCVYCMPATGVTMQRYKGLGEMNAEQLWKTTMDPETRTMLQITTDSAAEAEVLFSILMGSEIAPRSRFIQENAQYVRNLDV